MESTELTNEQINLMTHTISGPNRNWFATDNDCSDSEKFEILVSLGYATKEIAPEWMGDDVIYRLTQRGKDLIK